MENKRNIGISILGILVIIAGGLLILDNFGLSDLPWKHYLLSWKTILVVIGLALLVSGKNYVGGIILITLGTVFWLPEFLDYQIALKQILWPSLLIAVGAIVLFRPKSKHRDHRKKEGEVTIIQNPDSNSL